MLQFGYKCMVLLKKGVIQMAENKKTEGLIYKNHPLRRIDNIIYYGSMADKYIIMLQILDTKKEQDMDVATRVSVQLQLTDPDLKSRDRVVKKSEKDSLYAAMDVGLHLAGAGSGREISERKGVRHDTKISAGGAGDPAGGFVYDTSHHGAHAGGECGFPRRPLGHGGAKRGAGEAEGGGDCGSGGPPDGGARRQT